ncbi:MAG: response regulator [Gammaproteobacteria bacterium]|nr:response regulator [Gammaproteobacteria bacterium]
MPTATATLLIADDDRLVLTTLAEGLRQAGYRVLEATDGDAAIRAAQEQTPDLAILDMRMLGRSGHDVAVWLRENTDIPFLFLSAYSDEATVKQAIAAGALGYLVKPLDVLQILPSIEAALKRGRELIALLEEEAHLSAALRLGRQTSIAVGILMARHRLTEQAAFEQLRTRARAERRKVSELAAELIHDVESSTDSRR